MAKARISPQDETTLEMALVGFQLEKQKIEERIQEIQKRLGQRSTAGGGEARKSSGGRKRVLSAAARKRIAAAQKKRWAEHRKQKTQSSKTAKSAKS